MTFARFTVSSRALACALVLGLAACSHAPKVETPRVEAPPQNPIERAVDLLDKGDETGAQAALKSLLKHEPGNPEANVLLASIQQDPVALLGPKGFAYTTEPGDTMLALSQRFLGNRLKFYQLSRYNGLKEPSELAPGTLLKIPGEAPKSAMKAAEPTAPRTPAKAAPRKAKPQAAAPAAATPRAPVANPAAAARLRSGGLAALSQGKAAQAVALLRRAAALAPGDTLITRDLARAERIAQTVHAQQ